MASYVVNATVQAQKMLDASAIENTLLQAITTAVLQNPEPSISPRYAPRSISTNIKTAYAVNFASQADSYFNYGYASHPDGIPSNNAYGELLRGPPDVLNDAPEAADVIQLIEDEIALEPIELLYYAYSPAKVNFMINDWLINDSGYTIHRRISDGEAVTTLSVFDFSTGGRRYRAATTPVYTGTTITFDAGEVELYVYPRGNGGGDSGGIYNTSGSTYIFTGGVILSVTIDLSLTNNIGEGTVLHQVMYRRTSTDDIDFWIYNQADNLYPSIHTTLNIQARAGAYPFAMIIDDKKFTSKGELTTDYKTHTEAMLDKLNINLDDLVASMDDPDDPDALDDVSDAFVIFAIDLNTNEQAGLAYLYEHFRSSHYTDNVYSQQDWIDDGFDEPLGQNGRIYSGARVKFNLNYSFSTIEVIVGDVTTYNTIPSLTLPIIDGPEIDALNNGRTYMSNGVEIGKVTKSIVLGNHDSYASNGVGYNNHFMILRKQLTETTFVQVVVQGIEHFSRLSVLRKRRTFSKSVLGTLADIKDGGVFLPIGHEIISQFDKLVASHALMDGLQVVIHVINVRKKKWYETGWLIVLRIVIAIFTWGTSETWIEFVIQAALQILASYLITELLTILVDLVGGEIAIILAAIAAVIAIANGGDGEILFDLITAEELLLSANYLFQAVQKVAADDIKDAQARLEAHTELLESKQEELERAEDLLDDGGIGLELYALIRHQPYVNFNETPREFFNRSIHLTNPGVLSLDAIDSYVGNTLVLPVAENNPTYNTEDLE